MRAKAPAQSTISSRARAFSQRLQALEVLDWLQGRDSTAGWTLGEAYSGAASPDLLAEAFIAQPLRLVRDKVKLLQGEDPLKAATCWYSDPGELQVMIAKRGLLSLSVVGFESSSQSQAIGIQTAGLHGGLAAAFNADVALFCTFHNAQRLTGALAIAR